MSIAIAKEGRGPSSTSWSDRTACLLISAAAPARYAARSWTDNRDDLCSAQAGDGGPAVTIASGSRPRVASSLPHNGQPEGRDEMHRRQTNANFVPKPWKSSGWSEARREILRNHLSETLSLEALRMDLQCTLSPPTLRASLAQLRHCQLTPRERHRKWSTRSQIGPPGRARPHQVRA